MRFAGQCVVQVSNTRIEIDDLIIIGEYPNVYYDIEPEISPIEIKNDEEIKKLDPGLYHVFFCGQYEWKAYEHWEFGTEYDIEMTEWIVTTFQLKEGE